MSDRRQRQKEQRAAKREAERKKEQRRELGRRMVTAVIFGLAVVVIFTVGGLFTGDDGATPTGYERYREQPTACGADQPPPEEVMTFTSPLTQGDITADSEVTATITTSCGEIVVQLDSVASPETVDSFVFLARNGFYDSQVFHRIVDGFVIQGGDPQADGTGGPGYVVEDEFPDDDEYTYSQGVVAMANRGANSTGSQFFIVVGDDARHLTPLFNVLGQVVSGEDTLQQITDVPTKVAQGTVEESLPLESVYIESIDIDVSES